MKVKISIILIITCLLINTFAFANEPQLQNENDYKKMPNAWHWTALYPPLYAVVGVCNGVRIYNEKKRIKQHNLEVMRYREAQQGTENIDFKNLIAIQITHNFEFTFRVYHTDLQQKTTTVVFYIDPANKQVYTSDKARVAAVNKFNDSEIEFLVVRYTEKFKITRCYSIDRYTGRVDVTAYEHPLTAGASFNHSMLDIKDNYLGRGTGTATRINIEKQKF